MAGTFAGFGQPTSAPLFGGSSATPSPFGATTTNPFGGTSTINPSPFGNTTNPTTTFGATPFGASNPFGTTAPTSSTPFGTTAPFGATTTSTGPTLFGSTPSTNNPSPFGTPSNPFGATPTTTTPSFGTTAPFGTTTAPSLFGGTPSTPATFGTGTPFTTTTPAPTSTPATLFNAPTTQILQQPPTPLQQLEALCNCFNPASPQCKLRHMFYNQVHATPDEIRRMNGTKPPHIDHLLWEQACRNNPDTSRFVPVQACGFADVKNRIAEQDKLASQQIQTLQDATKVIEHIRHTHTVSTMTKLDDYKSNQLEIIQRLIRVVNKIVVLEARGTRLSHGEEKYKRKLEMILQDLSSPLMYRAKIEEFNALSRISPPSVSIPNLDEKSLENIAKVLKEQRSGLEVLTSLLQKDLKDVQTLQSELGTHQLPQ